eukprot:GHRR01010245.1.p1 GENE.GHRR01010245.1~~GHRR01010245.1.p1  ORF type:complete len:866 (+),score=370.37 GHRR01010245.1:246-2600(+)
MAMTVAQDCSCSKLVNSISKKRTSEQCQVTYITVPDIQAHQCKQSPMIGVSHIAHHGSAEASNTNEGTSSGSGSCQAHLSLEWLRGCSVDEVRQFFKGFVGLGRKSVACISLLALGLRDFPVDVNVGRICARLGWIPMQAAESLESMEIYPAEPEVHQYLLDRLTRVTDLAQLYELHYLAITLGKVLCIKQLPNCSACPLQHCCEYALSGGPRLMAGGPRRRKLLVRTQQVVATADSTHAHLYGGVYRPAGSQTYNSHSTVAQTRMGGSSRQQGNGRQMPVAPTAAATAAEPGNVWDVEDLDVLFAAAPRQRRRARGTATAATAQAAASSATIPATTAAAADDAAAATTCAGALAQQHASGKQQCSKASSWPQLFNRLLATVPHGGQQRLTWQHSRQQQQQQGAAPGILSPTLCQQQLQTTDSLPGQVQAQSRVHKSCIDVPDGSLAMADTDGTDDPGRGDSVSMQQQQDQQQQQLIVLQQQEQLERVLAVVPPATAMLSGTSPTANHLQSTNKSAMPGDTEAAQSGNAEWAFRVLGLTLQVGQQGIAGLQQHCKDQPAHDKLEQNSGKAEGCSNSSSSHAVFPCEADIRTAYKHLAVLLHPDKCKLPQAPTAFAQVRRAHSAALQTLAVQGMAATGAAGTTTTAANAAVTAVSPSTASIFQGTENLCARLNQQQHQASRCTHNNTAAAAVHSPATAATGATSYATKPTGTAVGCVDAPSNKTRHAAVGLQLTPAVLTLLDLPETYMPKAVPGNGKLPVLLLVSVPNGKLQRPCCNDNISSIFS